MSPRFNRSASGLYLPEPFPERRYYRYSAQGGTCGCRCVRQCEQCALDGMEWDVQFSGVGNNGCAECTALNGPVYRCTFLATASFFCRWDYIFQTTDIVCTDLTPSAFSRVALFVSTSNLGGGMFAKNISVRLTLGPDIAGATTEINFVKVVRGPDTDTSPLDCASISGEVLPWTSNVSDGDCTATTGATATVWGIAP